MNCKRVLLGVAFLCVVNREILEKREIRVLLHTQFLCDTKEKIFFVILNQGGNYFKFSFLIQNFSFKFTLY